MNGRSAAVSGVSARSAPNVLTDAFAAAASIVVAHSNITTLSFGLVGYWLIKHDFEPAPLLLGMVLGPLMEENLRRALLISRGDWSVFITRPLSAVLMAAAAGLLVLAVLPTLRKKRDEVFVESEG